MRSASQATDSTCSGWTAKRTATKALRPRAPVIRSNVRKSSAALAAWRTAFTTWWGPGLRPNSSTSSMCESQVSGCQLAACVLVKAQASPRHVRPLRTNGFSVT